jgi:6-phosphogluconolactonase
MTDTPTDTGGQAGAGPIVTPPLEGPMVVYVSGYGEAPYPLTVFDFDPSSGSLVARAGSVDAGANPTYLALHPERSFLYAANERDDSAGGITAFAIAADGGLTPLNHVTGSDGGFAYLAVDPTGNFVLGASFNGGSVSAFPIAEDGSVGEQVSNVDFGNTAWSHCIGFDPSGSHVLVPNRGNHDVGLLNLSADGQLTPNDPASVAVEQGSGPRHIAVRSDGRFAFIVNEDSSSVTPFELSEDGILSPGQSVSALPADFAGQNSGAHIELSPDGRYVYASNRGHDSIAVFEAALDTGELTALGHTQTGRTPRDFDVDPTGEWLIVANQGEATLSVFRLGDDGSVTAVGTPVTAPPEPSAVQFLILGDQ